MDKRRTEMFCHNCQNDFTVEFDYSLNGNHVVKCPHCGHEHCRVIKNGEITDDRWDTRNYSPHQTYTYTASSTSGNGYSFYSLNTYTSSAWLGTTTAT